MHVAREIIRSVLTAFQTLTILPLPISPSSPGRAAAFFPLVGAWYGWLGASIFLLLHTHLDPPLTAAFVLLVWILLGGAFHEDGLADTADAVCQRSDPQRILAVMKDSRIGTFGTLALLFSVGLRWLALANLGPQHVHGLVAVQALARGTPVLTAYVSAPAGGGLGRRLADDLTHWIANAVALQMILIVWLCCKDLAVPLLALAAATIMGAKLFFESKLGGVTGDCLGATEQVTETALLIVLACLSSI